MVWVRRADHLERLHRQGVGGPRLMSRMDAIIYDAQLA